MRNEHFTNIPVEVKSNFLYKPTLFKSIFICLDEGLLFEVETS